MKAITSFASTVTFRNLETRGWLAKSNVGDKKKKREEKNDKNQGYIIENLGGEA